ncbi:dihydrodipicolinate reductase C-terminal domain-containing protein [Bacteriovorax sp. PP10]|uniref:4-hydroxy-tetrahydrodipicolinate reductase n=1 Tax=Bacteriovorax antarcticus TaxID=3088717 RepID=A0ABU5VUJ4_9BACT|nr:dihydrodipicolinate reductase C-terminal domain-containing protein [Bacteriovorax sp. PP10]MEA9356282.1 dihydrodipicolinate reductase C-terminal domain-containing protein [Bacteriovorax sp. PP10]
MKIRIGLLGFGRTGSIVAKELVSDPALSLEWVCKRTISKELLYASHSLGFDKKFAPFISEDKMNKPFLDKNPVDIVIDFSSSNACKLYSEISKSGAKIVSAISNYTTEQFTNILEASKETAILHSPNITLGINWLMMASKLLQKIIPHADIEVIEEHFRDKKDISGTALKLATNLNLDPGKHVNSIRVGGIIGKHEVIFGLPHQTLRLTHESINRAAFGTGAIFASKWLQNKENGLYSMDNAIQENFVSKLLELTEVQKL